MRKYNYFSVDSGDSEDQLSRAIASYIFNLMALGLKVPATEDGIRKLEQLAQGAFSLVLADLFVNVYVDPDGQRVKVVLS